MSTIRDSFVARFGEAEANKLEAAAHEHDNGLYSTRGYGSDPFKWVLLITIGHECWTRDAFRTYHGVTAPVDELKAWVKEHGDLASHDGDFDYLAALTGAYNEYMPEKADA